MTVRTALDDLPPPPSAQLLGWRLVDARPDDGWVRIAFCASEQFLNPAGFVQGGLVAAMLDDAMGPAVFAHTEGRLYTVTIDMNVSFLAPARAGELFAEAQVVQLGRTVGFVEAFLADPAGTQLARAKASVRLVPAETVAGRGPTAARCA